jgi:hypothetical protein
MTGSIDRDSNFIDKTPEKADNSTQLAYFSPLDWLDYAGLAWDAVERVHIETTMPEGREKDSARLMNNLYTAIDAVMAAIPGGGGGGPALRAAMATSHEAGVAAWKALPDLVKVAIAKQVAQGMNWSLVKTQQAVNVLFSVRSNTPSPQQDDGSSRDSAGKILGSNMDASNKRLKQKNKPTEPGWERQDGYAAHHIVPYTKEAYAGDKRGEFVKRAQAVLEKFKVGINEAANGVFLPGKDVRVDSRNGGGAYHPKVHTATIYKELADKLEKATSKSEVYKVLDEFRDRFVRNLDKKVELPTEERYAEGRAPKETRTALVQPIAETSNYEQQPQGLVAERLRSFAAAIRKPELANEYARTQESDATTNDTNYSESNSTFSRGQRPISTYETPGLRDTLAQLETLIGTMEQEQRAATQTAQSDKQTTQQANLPKQQGDQHTL